MGQEKKIKGVASIKEDEVMKFVTNMERKASSSEPFNDRTYG